MFSAPTTEIVHISCFTVFFGVPAATKQMIASDTVSTHIHTLLNTKRSQQFHYAGMYHRADTPPPDTFGGSFKTPVRLSTHMRSQHKLLDWECSPYGLGDSWCQELAGADQDSGHTRLSKLGCRVSWVCKTILQRQLEWHGSRFRTPKMPGKVLHCTGRKGMYLYREMREYIYNIHIIEIHAWSETSSFCIFLLSLFQQCDLFTRSFLKWFGWLEQGDYDGEDLELDQFRYWQDFVAMARALEDVDCLWTSTDQSHCGSGPSGHQLRHQWWALGGVQMLRFDADWLGTSYEFLEQDTLQPDGLLGGSGHQPLI